MCVIIINQPEIAQSGSSDWCLAESWSAQAELPVVNTGRGQSSGDLVTGTRGWSLSLIGCLTTISRQPQGTVKSARVGNIPDWRDSGKNDSIRMRREPGVPQQQLSR